MAGGVGKGGIYSTGDLREQNERTGVGGGTGRVTKTIAGGTGGSGVVIIEYMVSIIGKNDMAVTQKTAVNFSIDRN